MHPIQKIAAKLALQGKNPTLALVKAQLPQPLPMHEVINEFKRYKAAPEQYHEDYQQLSDEAKTNNAQTTEPKQEASSLSQQEQIDILRQELELLKKEVNELKKSQ